MKKTILAGIAGAAIAGAIGFAAPAQAAPCSYFSSGPAGWERTFCGVPDAGMTLDNARTNLQNNLNMQKGLDNLKKNLDPRNWG